MLRIQHFEQRRLRVAAEVRADFVDFVDHHHRIFGPGIADRADDRARHRADVRTAMAANFGLVAYAADREAHEFASHRPRDRLAERGLAHARRSDEAQNRSGQLLFQFADRQILDDAVFDLLEIVVILIENFARLADVDVIRRFRTPRQLHQPIEVGADDAVFGTGLRDFRETVELTIGCLLGVFRHLGFVDLGTQLVVLGLLRIDFA